MGNYIYICILYNVIYVYFLICIHMLRPTLHDTHTHTNFHTLTRDQVMTVYHQTGCDIGRMQQIRSGRLVFVML